MEKKIYPSDVDRKAEDYARRLGFRKRCDNEDFSLVVMGFKAGYKSAKREDNGKI